MQPIHVIIAMAVWTVLSVVIVTGARKGLGKGVSEFFLGGRKLGGFLSGMTYAATTYSAFMLVGLVGLTYRSGVGALGFEMTYLVFTVLFLVTFGPRFWVTGTRFGHITPPELLANRYRSKGPAVASAVISLVMLVPYSAVQLMGSGLLVSGLTGGRVPFMAGVIVMALLSGYSALWAGMRSIAWTDAFQAVTMIVTSVTALVFVMFEFFGSPGGFFSTLTLEHPELLELTWDPNLFIGLTLPWAFFALTNPQVSQRMFVPNNPTSLRKMIVYFALFGFAYTVISTLFGYQAASIVPGLSNPDQAMPALLSRIPVVMGLIIFIGIFAAASSTLGSIVLTLSSLFVRDIVNNVRPGTSERTQTMVGKIVMAVIIVICIFFARAQLGLISVLSSMASGGLLVMAPATIGVFFWKRGTATGATVSMVAGGIVTGLMYVTGFYPLGWWPPVWGLILTTVLFVTVSLVGRPPADAGEFIAQVERDLSEHGFRPSRVK